MVSTVSFVGWREEGGVEPKPLHGDRERWVERAIHYGGRHSQAEGKRSAGGWGVGGGGGGEGHGSGVGAAGGGERGDGGEDEGGLRWGMVGGRVERD